MPVAVYFGISILLSMGITSAVVEFFRHRPLNVSVSTIGYPIFANFNIDGFFNMSFSKIFVFPILAWLIFEIILYFKRVQLPRNINRSPATEDQWTGRSWIWAFIAFFVSAQMLVFFTDPYPVVGKNILLFAIGGAASLVVLLLLIQRLFRRTSIPLLAISGIFANSINCFVFWILSERTFVVHAGQKIPYPWFSFGLAVGLSTFFILFFAVKLYWNRGQFDQAAVRLLYGSTVLIALPILIFLGRMYLPGPVNLGDMFHFGENLGSAQMLLDGALPYKESLFIHGLLADPYWSMLGFELFENSYWGHTMGVTMIWTPLAWSLMFLMLAFVFLDSPLLVLALFLILNSPPHYYLIHIHTRFIFLAFAAIAFVGMIRRPNFFTCFVFCLLGVLNFVLVPETAFALLSFGIAVLCFDFWGGRRFANWLQSLTFKCAINTLFIVACIFGYFYQMGILEAYFDYFLVFAKNHRYTGGIPFNTGMGAIHLFARDLLIVVSCLSFWFVAYKIRVAKNARPIDWFFAAWTLFAILYYQKFLARADLHLYQSFTVAVPLAFYLIYSFVGAVDGWVKSHLRFRLDPLATLAVVFAAILCAKPIFKTLSTLPYRTASDFGAYPKLEKVGFSDVAAPKVQMLKNMKLFFDSYLGEDGRLFDFTNTPALFHYFLQLDSPTRFFHISMASGEFSQKILVGELTKKRPEMISFWGEMGLMTWDGVPNMVRHYDVSEYILQNYEPFVELHGYVFFKRRDLSWKKPSEKELKFADVEVRETGFADLLMECNWGYAPNFFKRSETRENASSTALPAEEVEKNLFRFRIPQSGGKPSLSFDKSALAQGRYKIFTVKEHLDSPKRQIWFDVLPGAQRDKLNVQVSSCYQWYENDDDAFYVQVPDQALAPKIRIVN